MTAFSFSLNAFGESLIGTFGESDEFPELGAKFNSNSCSSTGVIYYCPGGRSSGDDHSPSDGKYAGRRGAFADDAGRTRTILGGSTLPKGGSSRNPGSGPVRVSFSDCCCSYPGDECLSLRGETCSGSDCSFPGGEFPRPGGRKVAEKAALLQDTLPETDLATMVTAPDGRFCMTLVALQRRPILSTLVVGLCGRPFAATASHVPGR